MDFVNWVPHILTAAGIAAVVYAGVLQVQRQHRSSLLLQEEHFKSDLRLRIYERIADAVEDASKKIGDTIATSRDVRLTLTNTDPSRLQRTDLHTMAISDSNSVAARAAVALILVIERYEIAFPGFGAMRVGLSEGVRKVHATMIDFSGRSMIFLPARKSERSASQASEGIWRPPTEQERSEIESLYRRYSEALYTLEAYTADVRIEAQNVLLGSLFGRRIRSREPGDPKYVPLVPHTYDS